MKIAVGSDMKTHLTEVVIDELKKRGCEVEIHGALVKEPAPWPRVAVEVAERVATGACDQAVLFCWTGTGISLAANKVRGVRAALCQDAETAAGARTWNDANVLAMSLRAVSEQVAKEILDAWFKTAPSADREDVEALAYLAEVEKKYLLPVENASNKNAK